ITWMSIGSSRRRLTPIPPLLTGLRPPRFSASAGERWRSPLWFSGEATPLPSATPTLNRPFHSRQHCPFSNRPPRHPATDSEQRPVQEPEGVNVVRAVRIAIAVLIAFTLATLWADRIMHGEERKIVAQDAIPSEIGKPQIGMTNQRLFELQLEAEEKRREK